MKVGRYACGPAFAGAGIITHESLQVPTCEVVLRGLAGGPAQAGAGKWIEASFAGSTTMWMPVIRPAVTV